MQFQYINFLCHISVAHCINCLPLEILFFKYGCIYICLSYHDIYFHFLVVQHLLHTYLSRAAYLNTISFEVQIVVCINELFQFCSLISYLSSHLFLYSIKIIFYSYTESFLITIHNFPTPTFKCVLDSIIILIFFRRPNIFVI